MLAGVTANSAISVDGLTVNRGNRRILDGLSFEVARGEIVGLLGPNGAGKTTTLGVLSTLIAPAAGKVRIAGHDLQTEPAAVRRSIGRVPQEAAVYPAMTARENVVFFARLLGMRRTAARAACVEVIDRVGLAPCMDEPASTFSGGMQRRLSLACGLLGSPPVLLLDEPTAGVDPQSRERILKTLRELARSGSALVYSTHLLSEAEKLCDRVVLIDHGQVIAAGTPANLIRDTLAGLTIEIATAIPLPTGWLSGLDGARTLSENGSAAEAGPSLNGSRITVDTLEVMPEILRRATESGGAVNEFHVHRPSLQDVFLALTGQGHRD